MRKRIISIILSLIMVVGILPIVAYAAFTPTVSLRLDGSPTSPATLRDLSWRLDNSASDYISLKYLENPEVLMDNSSALGTYSTTGSISDGAWNLYLGGQLFYSEPWQLKLSNANPLIVDCYTITYKPGAYGQGSEVKDFAIVTGGNTSYPIKFLDTPFTRENYTQIGWAYSDGGPKIYNLVYSTPPNPNIRATCDFYAAWKADEYSISYTLNGGTASGNPTVYTVESNAINLTNPTRTGYTFMGWTGSNGETAQTSVTIAAGSTGDKSYTASWTADTYSITYDLNGGAVSPANPTSYTIESSALNLNNPEREGYTFIGWTGSNSETAQTNVTIAAGSTGNKTYTANWKADAPSFAPNDYIVTAKTDRSITITTQDGYEYSVGESWYSGTSGSYTFEGLNPETTYSLVYRKAAVSTGNTSAASDASAALTVSTKTASASVPVPAAPTIGTDANKPTSGSISISTVAGNEYYISDSATADWSGAPSGYFKATDSGTHKFDSLSPATRYYIHVRVAETGSAMPSASSNVSQYTLPETPIAGEGYSVNYSTEKITITSGYEVNTDVGFAPGTAVANNAALTAGTTYTTYYVRVAANGGAPASEAVSFSIPARPASPTAITADKTKNSITITPVAGQEYKIEGGEWQTSGEFTVLSANTEYTVYARVKAVSSGSVSFASEAYSTIIRTKSDGSVGFALPTISVSPTYAPGKTLNDISLPTGWTWSAPATVPTVAINSYSAVYAPTDADTVDYTGIAGYAVDGGGKVTITRSVPLTVNRATPTAADFTFTAPTSLDYSGTAKTAAVALKSGISGMGAFTVKYYQGSTEIVAPTNVGTYTVEIYLVQGDNYAAATAVTDGAWTFTIAKVAQAPLSITGKPAIITYGDTFTLATTGGSGTGALTWESSNVNSATVDADGAVIITGVGETTITATKAADGNYSAEVMDTYTFTPAKRLITIIDAPSATGGWTKTYDGETAFDPAAITVGGITNRVGGDVVNVSVQSATYDTADIGSGDKTLTITYAIDGANSGNYSAPDDTVIGTASITAATPTITLVNKTAVYTDKKVEIDAATVAGVTGGTTPDGAITYTYYTKNTCTDADKTTVDKSGAEVVGGAPKAAGTYYVKATIAASGNYMAATSAAVTLTIYYPSSGEDKSSAPVIVDGKTVDMGTSEVKDGTTTVKVDQNKMSEQLKDAQDSVVIPITSRTDTASAELVVQNVENMAERSMTLTVKANDVSYEIPAGSVDTAALLNSLGASDSSKVPLNVTISKLSNSSVNIQNGMLMVPPVAFTVTATYNGKSVTVERFESYVQRIIEIPEGTDPKAITTAVVVETDGTQRHVPTEVYSENGKWYARINAMTNSTYALIQNSVSMTDTKGKWYDASVTEMASREIISGIGENMFAGERAITRAEFAAIIVRALGLPTDGKAAFTDVVSNAWYYGAVGTAFEYGIVGGKGDGIFDPSANITREEAMVMVARAAKLCGMDTAIASGAAGLSSFEDGSRISSWAYDSASFNVRSGLIKGSNGKIEPGADITRAETATVVLRLLQKAGLVDIRTVA